MNIYHNSKSLTEHVCVFDVDETMVHTLCLNNNTEGVMKVAEDLGIYTNPKYQDLRARSIRLELDDPVTPRGTGARHGCWGITRPHLQRHLKFAFRYFRKVIIWSAGLREYVQRIVRYVNRDNRKFDLIYHRANCKLLNGVYVKPLDKMIAEHPEVGPIEHMFIVDDREDIAIYNMDNLILIPVYTPELTIESMREDDDAFLRLEKWLMQPHVMKSTDVRTLDKRGIFEFPDERE